MNNFFPASVEERFHIDKNDTEQKQQLEVIVNDTISNFLSKASERILTARYTFFYINTQNS